MRRFRFLGAPLGSARKRKRAAFEFAEMVGEVVNCTISQAPITVVSVENSNTWYIAHVAEGLPAACGAPPRQRALPLPVQAARISP